MNAMTAMRQYQQVGLQAQVFEASPHQLIQMLMQGALDRLAKAQGALERGWLPEKGELIGKAVSIIAGLKDVLDFEQGGELATNLDRLYDYMIRRLSEANRNNDPVILEEVSCLIREIKSGWDAIAP